MQRCPSSARVALVESNPYNDADAVLHEAVKIQEHLLAQDAVLSDLVAKLARVGARRSS